MFSETCQTFFRCANNVPQLMRCPRGYRFDFNTRTCRHGHLVNCKEQMSIHTARYLLQSLYNNNNLGTGALGTAGSFLGNNGRVFGAGAALPLGAAQNSLLRGNTGLRHTHVVPGIGVINHRHPIGQTKVAVVNGQLVTKVVPHTHPFVHGLGGQQSTFVTGKKNKTTQGPVTARSQIPVPDVTTESAVPLTTPTSVPFGTSATISTAADVKQNIVTITQHDVIPHIMT